MKNVETEVTVNARTVDGYCTEVKIASSERKRSGEFTAEGILSAAKKMLREVRDDFSEFMEPVIEKEQDALDKKEADL